MPDHLHLVVSGVSRESDLKRFAKLAKQRSGAARALVGAGPMWQPGYWDTLLRNPLGPAQIDQILWKFRSTSRRVMRSMTGRPCGQIVEYAVRRSSSRMCAIFSCVSG
jgi:hypothetical protein